MSMRQIEVSTEVKELVEKLHLTKYQKRLAGHGFDTLECLYGIVPKDYEVLGFENGDRMRLQEELDSNLTLHSCGRSTTIPRAVEAENVLPVDGESPTLDSWGTLTCSTSGLVIPLSKQRPSIAPAVVAPAVPQQSNKNPKQVNTGGYTIGRHTESDFLILQSPPVSVFHCILYWINNSSGGTAILFDCSSNGTQVNGSVVGRNKWVTLRNDDVLTVSPSTAWLFRYRSHESLAFQHRYELKDVLGKGHFGTVHSCTRRIDGAVCAVKVIAVKGQAKRREALKMREEVGMLMGIYHPNIVMLKDLFEDPGHVYLVLECAKGGDLYHGITTKGKFLEGATCKIAVQLLEAVQYLHDRHIIHRDIKLENILLMDDDHTVKLTDFGLSKVIGDHEHTSSIFGTPSYMPPELLFGDGPRKYDFAIDIWSLGVVIYICLCGFPPFSDELNMPEYPYSMFEQITLGLFNYPSPYWDGVSDPALEFIDNLLTVEVSDRIKVPDALLHPWVWTQTPGKLWQSPVIHHSIFSKRRTASSRTTMNLSRDVEVGYNDNATQSTITDMSRDRAKTT